MSITYFTIQPYSALLAAYGMKPCLDSDLAVFPSYAKQPLAALLGQTIGEDFQLLPPAALKSQNGDLAESSGSFSSEWLVFACSGQGDF